MYLNHIKCKEITPFQTFYEESQGRASTEYMCIALLPSLALIGVVHYFVTPTHKINCAYSHGN